MRVRAFALGPGALTLLASCAAAPGPTAPRHHDVAVAYHFVCEPRDARVIVDESEQGQCLLYEQQYLGLEAGTHRLRVEREGYLPVERELPSTGRRETVRIQLRARPE